MAPTNKKKIALIEKYNQEKLRKQAMKMGVTLKFPETVFLSDDTKFGKNVVINQYVVIGKKTSALAPIVLIGYIQLTWYSFSASSSTTR